MSETPTTRPDPAWSDLPAAPPPDTSVKVAHLVLALLFLGAAGAWALVETGVLTADRLTLLGPALLIGAGVVGLAASLAGGRNRARGRAERRTRPTTDPTDPTPDPTGTPEETR